MSTWLWGVFHNTYPSLKGWTYWWNVCKHIFTLLINTISHPFTFYISFNRNYQLTTFILAHQFLSMHYTILCHPYQKYDTLLSSYAEENRSFLCIDLKISVNQFVEISFSNIHTHIYTYIHTHIHTHTHTYTHTYIHTHTYTHIHTHTYIHTYIHTHTYTHIHTRPETNSVFWSQYHTAVY